LNAERPDWTAVKPLLCSNSYLPPNQRVILPAGLCSATENIMLDDQFKSGRIPLQTQACQRRKMR
jgi:hypothetical protein